MLTYEIQQFGLDNLALVEREMPEPKSGEVVIRFHAASLNYRDLLVINGKYNPRMKLPTVPFSDGAGEIAAVGEGVTRWQTGDRVMPIFAQGWIDGEPSDEKRRTAIGAGAQWDGVLREYGVFDEQGLVKIPDYLSYEEAATLPCTAVTAWNALAVSGELKPGETVLTLGTGSVSIYAVRIAKLFGARVIATSSSEEKLAKLKTLGADACVNYKTRDDWDAAVLELTDKRGVDHVIEVGGGGTLAKSIACVKVGGHIALIGMLSGTGTFDPIPVFMKSIRLQGIFVGSRKMFQDMTAVFETHKLKPVIDRIFEFDQVKEALKYMEHGSHFGKIVVRTG